MLRGLLYRPLALPCRPRRRALSWLRLTRLGVVLRRRLVLMLLRPLVLAWFPRLAWFTRLTSFPRFARLARLACFPTLPRLTGLLIPSFVPATFRLRFPLTARLIMSV